MAQVQPISLAGVRIGFRNFEGREGAYNAAGDRNFVVFLDEDIAKNLESNGWNIKWPKPMEGGDPDEDTRQPYLQVSFTYKNFPPKIAIIDANGPTLLDEDTVEMLDWAEIKNVDIVIRPYVWEVNKQTGVKAYLKAMYVTIVTDEFAEKYGI